MKDIARTRLTQAVRVRSRFLHVCWPVILPSFFVALTAISFLCASNLTGSAAQPGQNRVAKTGSLAMTLSPPSFNHVPETSELSADYLWSERRRERRRRNSAAIAAVPAFYRALSLNEIAQRKILESAPMEFSKAARQTQVVMSLPLPDGRTVRFRVEESPVLAPLLAARFPSIKTYRGRGLDDPTATTRFAVTPAGFHAIVLSSRGTVMIEPDTDQRLSSYRSYYQSDAPKDQGTFHCLVSDVDQSLARKQSSGYASLSSPTGPTLRTYRLALAATAEFTQMYGGGTIAGALATMTTTINAVNAIYERDLAIHLVLIADEESIIFTNAATDGYTSNNATAMFSENQVVLDDLIGRGAYDLGMVLDGHVYAHQPGRFLFEGQGLFQSACVNGQKGKGVTILRSIQPSTTTAIWVLAHELGHKFGASHSFNGTTTSDCLNSRTAAFAYEPGTGSTIMGNRGAFDQDGNYQGLCGAEDLHSTDTYFHTASIEQIVNYTTFGNGSSCPVLTDTGNNPPVVSAGPDYTIPAQTPFALTASASDPEGDALTYCWEQFDLGSPGPPNTDNGNRPIFRSFAPATSPVRVFPQLSDVLSGHATFGESLPTTNRILNFRVTVRDNHSGGGGVNTGAMHVNVVAGGGSFAVTQPGLATNWPAGSTQTVTWNPANTAAAPVSCANVRLLLSLDGGNTFPVTLAAETPNTGTASIIVPNLPTASARIKVAANGNIFFNISAANFEITGSANLPPVLLTQDNPLRAAALNSLSFTRDPFSLTTPYNFSSDLRTRITLFAMGLELLPGEDASAVTAQFEDTQHGVVAATAEYVGKIPGSDGLTQIIFKLPEGLAAGDVSITISIRSKVSNKVVVTVAGK